MEKKEKILLTSTCGLGVVSIVFISLFAWKAATGGGGNNPGPTDSVNVNFTTEGCKVYKNDKVVTSDKAGKNVNTSYTIKLDDEYKQDYDFSEYSLKVYTLDGNEYDASKYSFNFKSGALVINADQDLEIKCRATLAVTKLTFVYHTDADNQPTISLQGVVDYIDWGDDSISKYDPTMSSYSHEYGDAEEGTEYTIRIVGSVSVINNLNQGMPYGPDWLKEIYFSHYIAFINGNIMSQSTNVCPVEKVYFEDGIDKVPSLSACTAGGSDPNIIKSVRLPETAKCLAGTFRDTQYIEEVLIPDNVTMLQSSVFGSSQVKKVNFTNKSKLTHVYDQAFSLTALDSLTLPKHVSHINAQAFYNSTNLKTLDLSLLEVVPSLGDVAGSAIIEINSDVFRGCTSLEKIIVPKGMKQSYIDNDTWKIQKFSDAGSPGEVLEKLVEAE